MTEHEHDWQSSPLLCYLATNHDGINYRARFLEVCSGCGLLRVALDDAPHFAGAKTYEDFQMSKSPPPWKVEGITREEWLERQNADPA